MVKLVRICCEETVRDLSRTSKIIEELLTVIFCSNILHFHGNILRQIREIVIQHSRFLSFPGLHDTDQFSDRLEALVKVIISQSKVFRGNRDMLKRACVETLGYLDLPIE